MLATLLLPITIGGLDEILSDAKLDGATVSAIVTRLDGSPVYERNSRQHVIPASNEKLLSGSFALYSLGPDYTPETRLWKLPNRTFVETTGDPLLTYQQLIDARAKLRLDRRLPVYVKEPYAPGIPDTWEYDDLPNKYAAPITAFTVDRGSWELWKKGNRIVGVPYDYGIGVYASKSDQPLKIVYDPIRRMVQVDGKWPDKDQRLDTLSLWRPDREAAFLLGSGFTTTMEAPPTSPDLVIHGKPLREMLPACLMPSDNNIAEHLLLLGARRQGDLGGTAYKLARERLTNFLERVVGVEAGDMKPYDGSGMSRHNYVTTRSIVKLLKWNLEQPTAAIWRASLALPGKGTLANRLKDVLFQGKTGTLDMVSALSGYVRHRSGQDLIISVILNQYACSAGDARDILDRFVRQAAEVDLAATEGAHGTS